jgi:Carboxypeptidase regulatory-like domain
MISTRRFGHVLVFLLVLLAASPSFPCDCGAPSPACAYIAHAAVVFVGTPVYTNEDHSGTFNQQTLYRFHVEEIFKGLPEGTTEVWVDPGSFTSCYAEYELGLKLLVFASKGQFSFSDSTAMTVVTPRRNSKPLPPGFNPKMPVYYAPECNGTRGADLAGKEIAWLRLWEQGRTLTEFRGTVRDDFGFPLKEVTVTAKGNQGTVTATTDNDGKWSINGVRAGTYLLSAELPGYRVGWNPEYDVPENACAYANLTLQGSGAISGTIVGSDHRPLGNVELQLGRFVGKGEYDFAGSPTRSSKTGAFSFGELPAGDYVVGVNLFGWPEMRVPYERTYMPGVHTLKEAKVLHLEPGQKISSLRMRMTPALPSRTIRVRVTWPDGRSVGKGVQVSADVGEHRSFELANTNSNGVATLKCLAAEQYKVTAWRWMTKAFEFPPRSVVSQGKTVAAGTETVSITLVLTKKVTGYHASEDE